MSLRIPRRLPRAVAALALASALTACGDDEPAEPAASAAPTSQPCQDAPPPTEPLTTTTTDLAVKPVVEVPDGPPPCDLAATDVVVGTGAEAVDGAQVEVKYVGVLYDTGEEFDSSWSRSPDDTLPFQLGAPGIIRGYSEGIAGMRVGGRRELVIPSDLGFGPSGQGPIPPDAALVFVIDLVEVTGP